MKYFQTAGSSCNTSRFNLPSPALFPTFEIRMLPHVLVSAPLPHLKFRQMLNLIIPRIDFLSYTTWLAAGGPLVVCNYYMCRMTLPPGGMGGRGGGLNVSKDERPSVCPINTLCNILTNEIKMIMQSFLVYTVAQNSSLKSFFSYNNPLNY